MNELTESGRWLLALLIAGAVGAGAWLIRLERRMNAKLDTDKFDLRMKELYLENKELREEIMDCLGKLSERGDTREKYIHDFKHSMDNLLNKINLRIHLIAQAQGVKLPPLHSVEDDGQ